MLDVDLQLKEFLHLSKENLKASLQLAGLTFGPVVLSAVPVLLLVAWIHISLGFEPPPGGEVLLVGADGDDVELHLAHQAREGGRSGESASPGEIAVMSGKQVIYLGNPLSPPAPALRKRRWWNAVLNSPAGYLADDAPVDVVHLNVGKRRVIKWMPRALQGWEFPFFGGVVFVALGIKLACRIE